MGTKKAAKADKAKQEVVIAYKGFDKDLKCRGFQYEVGETYEHEGKVAACEGGFHSCEHPLSVLSFYPLRDGNRYAAVEASGDIDREHNKIASRRIKVTAEIGIPGLIKAAVAWASQSAAKPTSATSGTYANSATSGTYAHSATSGTYANSATSGYSSKSETSGPHAVAANAGDGPARAGESGAIFLVERGPNREIVAVFASKVGDNGIKAGVWYALRDGKPQEVA